MPSRILWAQVFVTTKYGLGQLNNNCFTSIAYTYHGVLQCYFKMSFIIITSTLKFPWHHQFDHFFEIIVSNNKKSYKKKSS